MKHLTQALIVYCSFTLAQPSWAQSCAPSPERHAQAISGEIAGKHTFIASVAGEWTFKLEPSSHGWDIRLRDQNGMDLGQITPPFHSVPNARELYGWHFRNAANTGKNTGHVNAPQHIRLFEFSPSLTGTGGYRPPRQGAPDTEPPDPDNGRGVLTITEMGLADLEPGQQARMNYLKFRACLTWPKSAEEKIEELNAKSPIFLDEEKEMMYGCGLDHKKYELSAWILPRWTGGDLDGDDAHEDIAPIIRKSDGRKGIAICRSGTWVSVIGYGEDAQIPLETKDCEPCDKTYFSLAQYLDRTEVWQVQKKTGHDDLILGRAEKAELAIHWDGEKFTHELLWVIVEP